MLFFIYNGENFKIVCRYKNEWYRCVYLNLCGMCKYVCVCVCVLGGGVYVDGIIFDGF